MTRSAAEPHPESRRFHARRLSLLAPQIAIEEEAMWLRAELGISEFAELPLETAARCLPNCEVFGLKHLPGITLHQLVYARTKAYRTFGALAYREGGKIQIVFNDAHQAPTIRVNVMEEIFHIRLGHKPDILRSIPCDGQYRSYDPRKENEARGCAIASLVPFGGLYAMLCRRSHIARIAEHFAVSVDVVQERIEATNLGDLMNVQSTLHSLVSEGF